MDVSMNVCMYACMDDIMYRWNSWLTGSLFGPPGVHACVCVCVCMSLCLGLGLCFGLCLAVSVPFSVSV